MALEPIRLHGLRAQQQADCLRLEAMIGNDLLWFEIRGPLPVRWPLLPFLPLLLQEAMASRTDALVESLAEAPAELPIGLAENLPRYQQILTCWNPTDLQTCALLGPVPVMAHAVPASLCCFSGGIDSQYSYFRHRDTVSHLLLVQGFDQDSSEADWQRNVAARQRFATLEQKPLITVASNLRTLFEQRRLSWGLAHGGILGAIGGMFAPATLIIPSSFTYDNLFPWGSHPLLDICWNSAVTTIRHHGLDQTRTGKTVWLSQFQHGLDLLQVCWRGVDGNCGNCPKCVRTSLVLHVLGKHSASLPPYKDPAQLRWLKPGTTSALTFTEDLIRFCHEHERPDLYRPLRQFRRRFLVKFHLEELMKALFGRLARRISHRLWPKAWQDYRVRTRGADDVLG